MKPADDFLQCQGYRLPTEAEWEYACRAHAVTSRCYGQVDGLLPEYAWYRANSGEQSQPGGMLKPNDFGIFDMHGNVSEWCHDRHGRLPNPGGNRDRQRPGRADPTGRGPRAARRILQGRRGLHPPAWRVQGQTVGAELYVRPACGTNRFTRRSRGTRILTKTTLLRVLSWDGLHPPGAKNLPVC